MQVLQPNLGAVMGYGVALQASCLEGFDSLGLHQVSKVFIQQITKIQLLLENKTNTDLLCLVHIMAIMIGCLPVQRGSIPLRGAIFKEYLLHLKIQLKMKPMCTLF